MELSKETVTRTHVRIKPLKSQSTINTLNRLKNSLKSSYGPKSRTKLISCQQSEEVRVGSSSTLLIDSTLFDVDDAVIKLIVSSVKQHLKVHYDHGLYCLLLCIALIENGLKSGLPTCLIAQCFRWCAFQIHSHIKSTGNCEILHRIEIDKVKPLTRLLSNVLETKSALSLSSKQSERLSIVILNAYLKCMPENSKNSSIIWPAIHFVQSSDFDDLNLYSGLLLDLHHYTQEGITELFKCHASCRNINVAVLNISLTVTDLAKIFCWKDQSVDVVDKLLTEKLKDFAQSIINNNIFVVFNQKVIADELKHFFKTRSVIVIDRIGTQPMEALACVTTAKTVGHISDDLKLCMGYIQEVAVVSVKNKAFVHVINNKASIASLIVPYKTPYVKEDLMHVCWAAVSTLDKTLRQELVIEGGGKMESYLVEYIKKLHSSDNCIFELKPVCSVGQLQSCLNCFCSCLEFVSLNSSNHDMPIFDCFDSKINAFVVAVQTACIALEIKYQICEQ